MIRNIN